MSVTVHHGDCLDVLRGMAEASVDSVVTDPPYGLGFMGKTWERFDVDPVEASWSAKGRNQSAGRDADAATPGGRSTAGTGFRKPNPRCAKCGRARNGADTAKGFKVCHCEDFQPAPTPNRDALRFQAFMTEWAREVYRVMKPGAHLVAFGGTRTYHRLACAIEDAGFEVRDQLGWVYGTGFPKSLDVGKAIDKRPGVTLHKTFAADLAAAREAAGLSRADLSERVVGTRTGACWNWEHHQFPEFRHWASIKANLPSLDDRWGAVLAQAEREVLSERVMVQGGGNSLCIREGERREVAANITAPATDAARQWQGWGTALKPAWEPIVLARKPLACPTVAAQVLATGTGALNVDGCRIPSGDALVRPAIVRNDNEVYGKGLGVGTQAEPAGRWPANLCHDGSPEVLEAFGRFGSTVGSGVPRINAADEVTGAGVHDGYKRPGRSSFTHKVAGQVRNFGDGGSPARFFPALGFGEDELRFFYSAKAGKADRCGSVHPTIKPVALMRWLCRLITPPGGVVLDPFAGSGTTGEAALREGFSAVLIEREAEYVADIERRLARYRDEAPLLAEVAA